MIGPSPSPPAPGSQVKNGDERLVVLNAVARSVIEARRGHGGAYVFTCKGKPVSRMMSSAWKRARIRTGLPQVRVHEGADPDCYTVNAREYPSIHRLEHASEDDQAKYRRISRLLVS